mmetsp:Transcript_42290/g.102194  ORF Transcript_42290/g.102194 Transcript_42290/m.102194 type:complete len:204 (-) Transcript_42290:1883-2494(-)
MSWLDMWHHLWHHLWHQPLQKRVTMIQKHFELLDAYFISFVLVCVFVGPNRAYILYYIISFRFVSSLRLPKSFGNQMLLSFIQETCDGSIERSTGTMVAPLSQRKPITLGTTTSEAPLVTRQVCRSTFRRLVLLGTNNDILSRALTFFFQSASSKRDVASVLKRRQNSANTVSKHWRRTSRFPFQSNESTSFDTCIFHRSMPI